MIPAHTYNGKAVGVFGLGKSGLIAVRSLVAAGASVIAYDDNGGARDMAREAGAQINDFQDWSWSKLSALVLAPGVPLTHPKPHPVVELAKANDVPIIGDIDIFGQVINELDKDSEGARRRPPVVAITGTNGKSTTTALLGHLLLRTGYSAEIGGNIGTPVLELDPPVETSAYALEMSSYQIDLTHNLKPTVAALLNISPDHLDRHGTLENYARVKARLLDMVGKNGTVVIGVDDALTEGIFTELWVRNGRRVVPVSVGRVLGYGVFVLDGVLYDGTKSPAVEVADLRSMAHLRGAHNWQNAAIAYACAEALGRDRETLGRAMATFPGLTHRMETVTTIKGVRFVNDSKATNVEAAGRALSCFDPVYWIAGGRAKDDSFDGLDAHIGSVTKAFLIGEASETIAAYLEDKVIPYQLCGTIDKAVAAANVDAIADGQEDPTVMLSPACASFDQYPNFEVRGEAFKACIELIEEQAGLDGLNDPPGEEVAS